MDKDPSVLEASTRGPETKKFEDSEISNMEKKS